MAKWIKFNKSSWGLSASILVFDRISFYCGNMDHWAIGIEINLHDRSLTFKLFNLYTGFEIYHRNVDKDD